MSTNKSEMRIDMNTCKFIDKIGSFELKGANKHTGLYFPLASESGLKSAITPELAGDAKLDQNHFLYTPASIENLHNDRASRNFWCILGEGKAYSLTGASASQRATKFTDKEEEVTIQAGLMWHKTMRTSKEYGLLSQVTSFIPVNENVEIHIFSIKNVSNEAIDFVPVAAFPVYGRSADNIRDHRHVTSLLHRVSVKENGIVVNPTLSFDERGHQVNDTLYFINGITETGAYPESFFAEAAAFIGEGGSFDMPEAIYKNLEGVKPGYIVNGQEAIGGLRFAKECLAPNEEKSFIIFAGMCNDEGEISKILAPYVDKNAVESELEEVKNYWKNKVNIEYHTSDENFDQFMNWVSFQPELRRLFGCSFLPHHDYGKGGRGWRDLWQDCLALLLMNPDGVRQMLLGNFAGIRVDGSNATIIGNKPGEFKADRNSITRVWMDHGVWPLITTKLYIDQTGDYDLLNQKVNYFKDRQVKRGTSVDELWTLGSGWQKDTNDATYQGSVLEHLLLQNLTAFYEVGEHNHIRLRDADWNDAIDMAGKRGESVAFTCAYAKNLLDLASLIDDLEKKGVTSFDVFEEIGILLEDNETLYDSIDKKLALLDEYTDKVTHTLSGKTITVAAKDLAKSLENKGNWMMKHLRDTEWVTDAEGNGWYNGYYDNNGRRVEGDFDGKVRMMLTGQVFSIMSGTATDEEVEAIVKSADKYLYDEGCGGYRLNTNFEEIKTDMGRMFGFAYGEKENGAVFSHMAVMYANALYQRGFAKEGYKSLNALYNQSIDLDKGHIFPGIPEYFGRNGRGLYHYLTGAASWYMMTVLNQMFGARGEMGALLLEPKLLAKQFDENGKAAISFVFAGINWNVEYENKSLKEYGEYKVKEAYLNNTLLSSTADKKTWVEPELIGGIDKSVVQNIRVILG